MYRQIMIAGTIVVGIGWLAYGIYRIIVHFHEKNQSQQSDRLKQAHSSMAEYAQKMAKFEKNRYDKNQ